MGKNKTQNDAPFGTFVLPGKMADVSIAGLQWFILIPRLSHTGSHREKKIQNLEKEPPTCCNPTY